MASLALTTALPTSSAVQNGTRATTFFGGRLDYVASIMPLGLDRLAIAVCGISRAGMAALLSAVALRGATCCWILTVDHPGNQPSVQFRTKQQQEKVYARH